VKRILSAVAVFLVFVFGAVVYTLPGPVGIWEQRTDVFMSDGTDLTTNPFQFDMLHREYTEHPSRFFYGAFPNHRSNAPEGVVDWYSTLEKVAGVLFPFFVPVEQVSVLFALVLMILNGVGFYGMARKMNWHRALALGLSIAWAFSAYTRARAQVHAGLVGIYAIPFAIWGLLILQKDRSWKGILKSIVCFLVCATSVHYYLIFLAFTAPFFLAFYFSFPETRKKWQQSIKVLLLAVAPAVLFLAFCFLKPVPSDFKNHVKNMLPQTGESQVWPHPFVTVFSASPEDYFSGDIAIGKTDWNPLRSMINDDIRSDLRQGNLHEHALGIRWVLWLFLIVALIYATKNRSMLNPRKKEGAIVLLFLVFGIFAFLASLPPDWGLIWGPSAWIHWAIPQIRVPNRMGIFVYFSLLILVGTIAQAWLNKTSLSQKTRAVLVWLFPILIVLDFPPVMNAMPMSPTIPSRQSAVADKAGPCGLGYHFPHVSTTSETGRFYYLLQSLRGTDCSVLNPSEIGMRDLLLTTLFGYQNKTMLEKVLKNDPSVRKTLADFAICTHLDWIAYDPRLPKAFIQDSCHDWGGKLVSPDFCRSQNPVTTVPIGLPDECLVKTQSQ
jgi:hypothetical protein